MDPVLTLTDAADAEAKAAISEGLRDYNREQAGFTDGRGLSILISDPATGKVVGGLTGWTSYGVFFLDLFHIPADMRRRGLGDRIMRMAEDEARSRGCTKAVVYTITFQAPAYCERHGYTRFGTVEVPPPGASRVHLQKTL
ncbi:MAG: GNAT family N-acetyltransferase [Alphaproteobacteria bacterium]|nr:GNAT family N-acetyltransferase [Alphaproteobacteria bacterium]